MWNKSSDKQLASHNAAGRIKYFTVTTVNGKTHQKQTSHAQGTVKT